MIKTISNITKDMFTLTVECSEGVKVYSIGEDEYISKLNDEEEWGLYNVDRNMFRCDGQIVYGLLEDLKEIEDIHIITNIVRKYLNGASVVYLREDIIKIIGIK